MNMIARPWHILMEIQHKIFFFDSSIGFFRVTLTLVEAFRVQWKIFTAFSPI